MLALLTFSLLAFAADVTGKWTAEVQGRNGAQTQTFNLKQDGSAVTGTIAGGRGDQSITEGKIDGDNISFVTVLSFNGNEIKVSYKGVVKGDTIEFTVDRGRGGPQTVIAKKSM
ncbi:MAG TPA: hypothetical protein VG273_26235 [Bryobacteraceae bacterium]|nr:hypothetical protein [Bryobacteraceae bacterium]